MLTELASWLLLGHCHFCSLTIIGLVSVVALGLFLPALSDTLRHFCIGRRISASDASDLRAKWIVGQLGEFMKFESWYGHGTARGIPMKFDTVLL